MSVARWALLAVLVAVPLLAPPATAPAVAQPVDLGVYGEPVRFTPRPGTTLRIGDHTYAGAIEVRREGNALRVVNEVSMADYVMGIGEMPARWPTAALRAQAVAARTYAWYQARLDSFDGYDICATTACQVYRGREVVTTPGVGQRWRRAVRSTAGQVLMHERAPILARYFSTSGGHTFDNEDVFTSEGPEPYLKGVPDPDDEVSPLHTWQARFTGEQFDAILSRGRVLSATVPVAEVQRVDRGGSPVDTANRPAGLGDRIRVTGRDGTVREVGVIEFRDFVSSTAPALFPGAFPGPRSDGERLPTTVPSSRFLPRVTDDAVILDGSGWGHGVGMGQYGAKGKADRGLGYGDILAAYYQGLRPSTPEALPDRIRVGLERTGGPVRVSADGPFRVTVGGEQITGRGLGSWRVRGAPDRTLGLSAPEGYGAPLVVSPVDASRRRPTTVETIRLQAVVNKTVELALEVRGPGGQRVARRALGVRPAGRHRVTWSPGGGGQPVDPGRYRVRLIARDETGGRAGRAVGVRVLAPGVPARAAASVLPARPAGGVPFPTVVIAALLGAAGGVAVGVAWRTETA